jgi:hypothetical protein
MLSLGRTAAVRLPGVSRDARSTDDAGELICVALVSAYGELWSRQAIDWGKRGRGQKGALLGEFGAKHVPTRVDVWNQEGVYILYADHAVVYVGLAHRAKLGPRLRGHRDDHLAGRWDQFSWYGMRGVLQDGTLGKSAVNKNVKTIEAVRTIEALMIRAAPTALNKSIEGLKDATLVRQVGPERLLPAEAFHRLIEATTDLQRRLEAIEKAL